MVCKNCGAELQKDDAFCGECGTEIKNEAVKCSGCGKFFNSEYGMCPFCGSEISTYKSVDEILTESEVTQICETQDNEKIFAVCPVCGNRYDAGVGLCVICGYSALELVSTSGKQEHNDSICPDCGGEIDTDYGLCFSCGYSVRNKPVNRETNEKSCEDVVNCSRHNKCFSANGGNCPFCSYTPEKATLYEKNKTTFVGTCEICDRESVLLRKHEINDWMGTRYRNMCENCISKYENEHKKNIDNSASKVSSFFSQHKKGIIIAIIVAIVFLLIIIISANSGYTCSQCGERFHEGKTVFGEYWCNDCFYDY